jgi:hypothetical protein
VRGEAAKDTLIVANGFNCREQIGALACLFRRFDAQTGLALISA